jgi:colanic acid biosynthesis protein WcaH
MNISECINFLDTAADNPEYGLPEELFLFASRITPMVNVDLLIKNECGQTLLTWRDDGYWKPGWHIPGGIIRYKEEAAARINAVARLELGTTVEFKSEPISITQIILPERKNRAHFISLLYECKLTGTPDLALKYNAGIPKSGEWSWHHGCPDDILEVHEIYRKFMQ